MFDGNKRTVFVDGVRRNAMAITAIVCPIVRAENPRRYEVPRMPKAERTEGESIKDYRLQRGTRTTRGRPSVRRMYLYATDCSLPGGP